MVPMDDRTWSLRLNLDAFNAGLAVQQGDAECAEFVRGFHLGINNGMPRGERPASFMDGFTIGHTTRIETDDYRLQQSINGKKGGRPKNKSVGSAPVNRTLTGAEGSPKPTVKGLGIPTRGSDLEGPVPTPTAPGLDSSAAGTAEVSPIADLDDREADQPTPALPLARAAFEADRKGPLPNWIKAPKPKEAS